jgi:hypothetical protein
MKNTSSCYSKVVVFDLDETLGYFGEFFIFYSIVASYLNISRDKRSSLFNSLFELYPEYLRPDIINVLSYLKAQKLSRECKGVYIYTNNKGPLDWCEMIYTYLHKKIQYPLFDRVVGAFRVNGRVREVGRQSNDKTTEDLIRCAKLPDNSDICFIDNEEYTNMSNVYYIKLNTYVHNLSMNAVVNRFLKSPVGRRLVTNQIQFVKYINQEISRYKYTYAYKSEEEYEIDVIVSKKLITFLEEFFKEEY